MNRCETVAAEATKRTSSDEANRLRKALAQRTAELTEAKKQLLQLQEQITMLQEQLAAGRGRGGDGRAPLLPIADNESVSRFACWLGVYAGELTYSQL